MNRIIRSVQAYYDRRFSETKMLLGKQLIELQKQTKPEKISDIEFKVFSQWGDDGIIQYLIRNVELSNDTFVEFGVEDYREANTRFLLMNNNWRGLVMDGNIKNIRKIKAQDIFFKHELTARQAFITAENINDLLKEEGFTEQIGLLHIDIDGNDYWVWKALTAAIADIVVIEYNSIFGTNPITVPYNPAFFRTKAHSSNLYFGSSLQSLVDISEEKGYVFVGCNGNGNNAYFVKREKAAAFRPLTASEGFIASRFRESRGTDGKLTFLSGEKRLEAIRGLPVYNTRTNQLEKI
ncbi:MAG: hypothetical protein KKA07_14810 [Bacteroidetes bacterium]|nr:hypothetical protein [Bacteroidota bacterium]MBU1720331.1 hypothetical protein [Bacteroidota bacterium]